MAKDDERPKVGRKPSDEPGERVSTWLRQSELDRLIQLANKRDQSVSSLIAQMLRLKLQR